MSVGCVPTVSIACGPIDLSSRASQYSATFTHSPFKAKPCSLVGTAQTPDSQSVTSGGTSQAVSTNVHHCHRKTLNHFSLSADCRISAQKCTINFSSHLLTHVHALSAKSVVLVLVFCRVHKSRHVSPRLVNHELYLRLALIIILLPSVTSKLW